MTSNGGKANFVQAVQVNVSMLGNDCDETQTCNSKAFYSRRREEELESNVELFELLVLTIQADRRGGLYVKQFDSKVRA